ncbi:hypothetical protein NC653_006538 [Populus alba x Populus x berolinensis]|uniref:Uncharacterized protein n=1 Tax=Populus alba x Populus x berolinensis TaxID=444605 RepID=A0AAD6RFM1_9ROSI|nr:hypothetical protein NC653_006538 [Populus alba x Populus x berolinensis]
MSGGGMLAKASLKKETFDLLNNGGGRVKTIAIDIFKPTTHQDLDHLTIGSAMAKKGAQVKDTIVERAKKSTQYVAEKGARVKDTIVESDKKTSEYVAEKEVTAKDVIAQNGKKVVRCVEKVTKNLFIVCVYIYF